MRYLTHRIIRIFLLVLLPGIAAAIISVQGCDAGPEEVGMVEFGAYSLLSTSPLIGEESEIREPPPSTMRLRMEGESVEGWKSPPEKILRFPVNIGPGAILSMRVRVVIDKEMAVGSIILGIEFEERSETGPGSSEEIMSSPPALFQSLVSSWTHVDIPLDQLANREGELKLKVSGSLADDPEVWILWGEPMIYYPELRRNKQVLLIGVDTLRADYVSPYGADPEISPHLTELAQSGTMFRRTWAQSPWTLPSFASMITGEFPSRIGATRYEGTVREHASTIGEILRENGYATYTACGNPWLGNDNSGFHQGIDSLWFETDAIAEDAVDKTIEFINRSMNRDWFCFLHLQDPHSDFTPPVEFADKFRDPEYSGEYSTEFKDWSTWRLYLEDQDPEDIEQVKNLYRGEIAYVDQEIGRLLEWLETSGLLDQTLVIFSADHGEEFFENGLFGHGQNQVEVCVRVPLIIQGEGFSEGKVVEAPIANIDILPTICEYLDIWVPDGFAGVPLQKYDEDSIDEGRLIFGEECYDEALQFAVDWPYKCIINMNTSVTELYKLDDDPLGLHDISDTNPEICNKLRKELVTNVIARNHVFNIIFTGSRSEETTQFSGTFTFPDGIASTQQYAFSESDTITVDDNSIKFNVVNSPDEDLTQKMLVIYPSHKSYIMDITLEVNGQPPGDRFYPYGTGNPEPSGEAHLVLGRMAWPAELPSNYLELKSACYVVGVPGIDPADDPGLGVGSHDAETIEQLRSLGYLQ